MKNNFTYVYYHIWSSYQVFLKKEGKLFSYSLYNEKIKSNILLEIMQLKSGSSGTQTHIFPLSDLYLLSYTLFPIICRHT